MAEIAMLSVLALPDTGCSRSIRTQAFYLLSASVKIIYQGDYFWILIEDGQGSDLIFSRLDQQ